jgi:hypothetical protein
VEVEVVAEAFGEDDAAGFVEGEGGGHGGKNGIKNGIFNGIMGGNGARRGVMVVIGIDAFGGLFRFYI